MGATGSIHELGSAINAANQAVLRDMINLASAAGGTLTVQNDTCIVVTTNASGMTAVVDGITVMENDEIQAGALVELQFKIDQMMAAVQEGIKNSGKVSQTREGAARA